MYHLEHQKILDKSIAALGIPKLELGDDLLCPSLLSSEARERFPVDTALAERTIYINDRW